MSIKELKYYELNNKCAESEFNFKTTDDLSGVDGIVGQPRAE